MTGFEFVSTDQKSQLSFLMSNEKYKTYNKIDLLDYEHSRDD